MPNFFTASLRLRRIKGGGGIILRLTIYDDLLKIVTPVKTGVQRIYNCSKRVDSGLRRNDRKAPFLTSYEIIIYSIF